MDRAVAVVAVARGHRAVGLARVVAVRVRRGDRRAVRVAVAVRVRVADLGPVAVAVHLVAGDLAGPWVHRAVGVVAVAVVAEVAAGLAAGGGAAVGIAVAVAVVVRVPGRGVAGVVLVGAAVAVVVAAIAELAGGRGDRAVPVVAVLVVVGVAGAGVGALAEGCRGRVAVAVPVGVLVPVLVGDALVHRAVAVVVHAVAGLVGAGVLVLVRVVAVRVVRDVAAGLITGLGGVRAVAVAVLVRVRVPGGQARHLAVLVVDQAVAVVVLPVADLGAVRAHVLVRVVAVRVVRDVAAGLLAGGQSAVGVAVAVLVRVGVPVRGARDARVRVVGQAVAVVVHAVIADLGGRRVDLGLAVVAVLASGPAVGVGVLVGDRSVAVVVRGVRAVGLVRARVEGLVGVVAVPRLRRVVLGLLAGQHVVFDPVAVAVLVQEPGQRVLGALHVEVVHAPVAVVVEAVAELDGVRVHLGVAVQAVAAVRHPAGGGLAGALHVGRRAEAVAVLVRVPVAGVRGGGLVDLPVAVVIDPVAELGRARLDEGVGVVAVDVGAHPVPVGVDGWRVRVDGRAVRGLLVATGEQEQEQGGHAGKMAGPRRGLKPRELRASVAQTAQNGRSPLHPSPARRPAHPGARPG